MISAPSVVSVVTAEPKSGALFSNRVSTAFPIFLSLIFGLSLGEWDRKHKDKVTSGPSRGDGGDLPDFQKPPNRQGRIQGGGHRGHGPPSRTL